MIRACILIIAGGLAAQLSSLSPSSDIVKLSLVASVAALLHHRSRPAGYLVLGFIAFLQSGSDVVAARLDARFAGDSLLTRVRVVDFPRIAARSTTMLVEPLADPRLPPRSRVRWFEPPQLVEIGDIWEFELRLQRPRGHSNPGVFDTEGWLFRQKIHASGYVVNGKRNRKLHSATEGAIDGFRQRFIARTAAASDAAGVAAVLAAVGVGARQQISHEQWRSYALSGTSHLMAISGLHVGLSATFAFVLARVLFGLARVAGNAHTAAIASGVFAAALYATVSGLGVPAERAALMLVAGSIAVLRRRHVDSFAIVALAALLLYLLDPVASMAPGFSLSFSAVLLLLWLARRRQRGPAARSVGARVQSALRELTVMQMMLFFGLMPITAVLFQRVAWLAVPVNLLAVPLFSLVTVPFTLAGLVAGGRFEPLGHVALKIAATSIECLHNVIDYALRAPFADVPVAAIAGRAWPIVLLPALWVILPKGWPGRWVAPLAVAALLLYVPKRPDAGCIDAHILDVGHGLAAVVETRHRTLLYDTGAAFRGGGSVAQQLIVPYLKSRGIRFIDWLLVSHADSDHSGGVTAIFEYAEVGALIAGEPLRNTPVVASRCRAGQQWSADGVRFRLLHPGTRASWQGNDSSCVLLVEVGQHALLLTGDIEAAAEHAILSRSNFANVDAVVVPHHGSLTSSSMPFVDAVSPMLAIVSTGFANRWGFPRDKVVARWQSVGAEVLTTAASGAVGLTLCAADGLREVRRDRHERRRFWRENGR